MVSSTGLQKRTLRLATRTLADRRRFHRGDASVRGRMLLNGGRETDCTIVNVSAGGVLLRSAARGKPGDKVVVIAPELGRVHGVIVRRTGTLTAIEIQATARKRDRLADAITWIHNKELLGLAEDRIATRQTIHADVDVELADGVRFHAVLLDASATGANVKTDERPKIGEQLRLGGFEAEVVRLHDAGFAVQFTDVNQATQA